MVFIKKHSWVVGVVLFTSGPVSRYNVTFCNFVFFILFQANWKMVLRNSILRFICSLKISVTLCHFVPLNLTSVNYLAKSLSVCCHNSYKVLKECSSNISVCFEKCVFLHNWVKKKKKKKVKLTAKEQTLATLPLLVSS